MFVFVLLWGEETRRSNRVYNNEGDGENARWVYRNNIIIISTAAVTVSGREDSERTYRTHERPAIHHPSHWNQHHHLPPLQSGSIKLPMFDGLHSSGKPVPLLRLLLLLAIIIIIIMRTSTSQFAQAHLMESRLLLRSSLCSGICRHGHAENLRGRAGLKYKLGSWNNRQMRKWLYIETFHLTKAGRRLDKKFTKLKPLKSETEKVCSRCFRPVVT